MDQISPKASFKNDDKKFDFLIFGADGMQGRIVTRDLLEKGYSVLLSDLSQIKLKEMLKKYHRQAAFEPIDLRDIDRVTGIILKSRAEIIINCAEGDWNMNVYQACLQTRRHIIDLGSRVDMTRDQIKLDKQFKKIEHIAITGCGSVPGVGNIMLSYAAKKFDSIETIELGFAWDSNIKKFVVPFSIESILEEYTLPAPYMEKGRLKKIKPIKSAQIRNFRAVGKQKIFLVDHPEVYTISHYFKPWGVENIRFYASFPQHSERVINTLMDLTFADKRIVNFEETDILPDEFLAQLLKRMKQPRGYKEWENVWALIEGRARRRPKRILMECIVPPLKGWEDAGCNIDTGFPASIIAQMIKYGDINKAGSFAPEGIVPEKLFFKELRKKKMRVYENGKVIN